MDRGLSAAARKYKEAVGIKTARLKNIVIAVLLLLNAFLLVLLFGRYMQERSARDRALRQLTALYASSGVELPPSILPGEVRLSVIEPARDYAAEQAFAEALLGPVAAQDAGGGIYRYSNEAGQCLLRSGGAVEVSLDRETSDPEAFCDSLFSDFGYVFLRSAFTPSGGTAEGVYMLDGSMVFNATLTLTFSGSRLVSVTGSFLPVVEPAEAAEGIDAVTALVRFLDYSNASGEVCTAITGMESGYLLQSTASYAQRLIPAWRIDTDVNGYYVNFVTGEITRQ